MASQAITKQSSNLVLAGRRGVTVVPQPTPLTRLHYFDGKFLRASDLELEQRYLRSLVALSNQAGGAGVVHGFDCTLAGDQLEVGPGLAIDPEGRVLLLPEGRGVSLAALIEASRQSGALSLEFTSRKEASKAAAQSAFGTCEELAADDGDGIADGSSLYVITLCHAEALCGEEDVFGRLCAEACATSTERPYVLEGVLLRAVPVTLGTALAASKAVALTSKHLRSLVASAWFEDERRRGGSLISGGGLASGAWCLGAESPGGACVPIALVARAGASTRFFDAWTARRERIEAPARRYWAGRMAMRPWDVFLAQILQFQCQLTECLGDTDDPDDPCREARDLLRETSRRLGRMIEGAAGIQEVEKRETAERRIAELALEYRQLDDLRGKLADAAVALAAVPRERRLIACGITELPSAGYLPVVASSTVTVNDQVRAWMGEGVDLRFCAVRPDFVPHALEEAQHMERISLLAGLDNPANKPQVDILVPDGELLAAGLPAGAGYVVETALTYQFLALFARLLRSDGDEPDNTGDVTAGQPDTGAKLKAEAGSAKDRLAVQAFATGRNLLAAAGAGRSGETPAGGAAFYHAGGSARLGSPEGDGSFSTRPRWAVESLKRVHRVQPLAEHKDDIPEQEGEIAAARQEVTGELWVRLETDRDLFTLARSGRTRVTGELAFAVRLGDQASAVRGDLAGDLVVVRREERGGGEGGVQIAAELRGALDLAGDISGLELSRRHAFRESLLFTRTAGTGDGPATLVAVPRLRLLGTDLGAEVGLTAEQRFTGAGRATFQLALTATAAKPNADSPDGAQTTELLLAAARAERDDRVAEPAHRAHEASVSALRNLSAVFRDQDYDDLRARLLFPGDTPDTAELRLRAVHDWVLFHRRRTKDCGEIPAPARTVPRRYRVFYRPLPNIEQRDVLLRLLREGGGLANYPMREIAEVTYGGGVAAIEEPPVDTLQQRWELVTPAGSQLALGAIASREAAAAEGRSLAENRLGALANVLDDRTPLHPEAEVEVLPGVPADLDAGDADGVIVLAVIEAALTCQDVRVATEAAFPASVIKQFTEQIRTQGLFPQVVNRLQMQRLGQADFAGAELQAASRDKLIEEWKKLQEERPNLFANAVPVALVISQPGTPAADLPEHLTQGEAVFTALSAAAGSVLEGLPNGGQEFPVECPALTLILLERIEIT